MEARISIRIPTIWFLEQAALILTQIMFYRVNNSLATYPKTELSDWKSAFR